MAHRIIATEYDRAAFMQFLKGVKLPVTFQWQAGRDRSLDQNRLQFLWAREAADQRGDMTADEVRQEWKLHHGVPILREEDEEFRAFYDVALKPLPYAMKLAAMKLVEVTSKMKVPQMVRYLDAVQRACAEQGIRLTDPDGELAAYQARYRPKAA